MPYSKGTTMRSLIVPVVASFFFGACSTEDVTGACISTDGASSYCFEDKEDYVCSSGRFSAGKSCAAVGYPYFCTSEDMRASGTSDVYAVSRYLNNSGCNPSGGASGGGGGGGANGDGGAGGQAYVQFYANPTEFSREAGLVITSIEAIPEGRSFSPSSTKGVCADRIVIKGGILEGASSPRVQFKLHARNYNSLDTAFGAEYTEQEGYAVFYISEFKPGCNTLEVDRGGLHNLSLHLAE